MRRATPLFVLALALGGCLGGLEGQTLLSDSQGRPLISVGGVGPWLGGTTPGGPPPYENSPMYQLGLGGTWVDPATGARHVVPARPWVTDRHMRQLERSRERSRKR